MAGDEARLATVADAREVARLLHARDVEHGRTAPRAEVLAERLATLLQREDAFAVVVGALPSAVGLVTLRPSLLAGVVARLDVLVVDPDARGAGVGAQVLALVVREAARRAATELEVVVDEADVDAQRFLARHGMALADVGERAVVLRRTLG